MWLGDDFHHNGAFRLSYGFEYAYMMESSKEIADVTKVVDKLDAYEWYLKLGPLANADQKYFQGKLPTWTDFVNAARLRRFLEAAGVRSVAESRHGADSECRRAGGIRKTSTGRSRSTNCSNVTTLRNRTSSSLDRGITAAGREATALSSAASISAVRRRRITGRKSWRLSLPTI